MVDRFHASFNAAYGKVQEKYTRVCAASLSARLSQSVQS